MPWAHKVAAILLEWMPGQEIGEAIVDVLFHVDGAAPLGRLPLTMPNIDNEQNFSHSQWPGQHLHSNYSEGLLMGYRWYDAHSVAPRYASVTG